MSPKLFPELQNRHGYVVMMFPNDHLPAHVHVYKGEKVSRINFEPEILSAIDSYNFKKRELDDICQFLQPYRQQLIELWNATHPDNPFNPSEDAEDE